MNIHLICWARNECDVLEAHVRHHATYATSLTYVLHRSRDNSAEILSQLAAEGLPVSFRTDERMLHEQESVMTQLLHEARNNGADWILPLDADEFLCGDVQRALEKANEAKPVQIGWRGYVPTVSDREDEKNVLRRITHRRSSENPQWYKVMIPKLAVESDRTVLTFGNHGLRNEAGTIVHAEGCDLTIAHFPVRSEPQFQRKIYGGWLSHLSDPLRPSGATFQWEIGFRTLRTSQKLSRKMLQEIAMHYADASGWEALPPKSREHGYVKPAAAEGKNVFVVQDAVPCNFEIRYYIKEVDPLSVLMEAAENLAEENAHLKRTVRKEA